MRRLAPALALIITFAAPVFAAGDDDGPITLSPQQVGDIFCIARLGNDTAPIEALATPSLKKVIAHAEALDAAYLKKHPGDEPPLGDGIPWQSTTDYANTCAAKAGPATAAEARVGISYGFTGEADADYADTLVLKPVPDAAMGVPVWRIDDVVYPKDGDMRQALVDAFKP